MLVSIDLNGITSWNHNAEKILDYSAGDAIGQSIADLAPESKSSEVANILERLAAA